MHMFPLSIRQRAGVRETDHWLRICFQWILVVQTALSFSGCAVNPFSTGTPARVEERPAAPQPLPEKMQKPEAVPAPVPAPVPESSAPVTMDKEKSQPPAQKPAEQKTGPAVVALLDDADQYAATGKKQQAVASIERALRIEPKNPVLWHKLGKLHLAEGEWDQAIAMAKKSNVLAPGNNSLQAENWLIIARAKEAQGDAAGALQAIETARRLRTN
jgi:hypothetical protein